ncbi:MAG TPA: TonB-dependent receptor, partial [Bacteroidia bacterium]|nr:TonB-dependent receptor [Bacteroidia bacterium]
MKLPCTFLFVFLSVLVCAQGTSSVRGQLVDKETRVPLIGAVVQLFNDTAMQGGAVTDVDGNFRIDKIPVGRYTIKAQYTGYLQVLLPNIIVNTGKETILNLELETSAVQVNEVVIKGDREEGTVNEMSSGSGRMFSVEETNRYGGSRGDPARMASNFAGVQGANDSRNDIVVRGNSPMGVLWRFEGVDIPNPNHFAIEGTTGGPVSMLNNKVLANSDFFTGAFSAEYGNSIAAAFDLRMRNGNNEKFEFNGQFGFLGTELTAEGPINKTKGSSFLVNYRYSTLKMFEALNFPIGTGAVPNYMDGAFKLNFPLKNGGNLSWFGIAGNSKIDIVVSDFTEPNDELYGVDNRDQYFKTGMGFSGIVYAKPINDKTFFRMVVAGSHRYSSARHDLVWRDTTFAVDSITQKMGYKNTEDRISLNFYVLHRISPKHTIKAGMFNDMYVNNLEDSIYSIVTYRFYNRQDYSGNSFLIQPYVQWKFRPSDLVTVNLGVHGQYFTLNGSTAIEPRAGMRWSMTDKQSLNVAVGMHSQVLPAYVYYTHLPATSAPYTLHNKDVDFMKSLHTVVGYDLTLGENMRIKVEGYYQYLYNIPVEKKSSSFSVLNQGSGFSRFFPDTLVNEGTGRNYGLEFTLEKFFSKQYFFMFTASVFDAKYKGSDGILRNTDFNT